MDVQSFYGENHENNYLAATLYYLSDGGDDVVAADRVLVGQTKVFPPADSSAWETGSISFNAIDVTASIGAKLGIQFHADGEPNEEMWFLIDNVRVYVKDETPITYDPTKPTAYITNPIEGGLLAGPNVAITGSATDSADFASYTLRYGEGLSPETWTNIANSTSPVVDGTLGMWDISAGLTQCVYSIQLLVSNSAGNQSEFLMTVRSKPVDDSTCNTWYVDKDNTSGIEDGTSWGTAFSTVQPAINAASAAATPYKEVWVAEGVYDEERDTPSGALQLKTQVDLYGGFTGIETSRSERDWESHVTTLDGSQARDGFAAYHVLEGAAYLTLDGFTITGGAGAR